jgi:hypothetical protein
VPSFIFGVLRAVASSATAERRNSNLSILHCLNDDDIVHTPTHTLHSPYLHFHLRTLRRSGALPVPHSQAPYSVKSFETHALKRGHRLDLDHCFCENHHRATKSKLYCPFAIVPVRHTTYNGEKMVSKKLLSALVATTVYLCELLSTAWFFCGCTAAESSSLEAKN